MARAVAAGLSSAMAVGPNCTALHAGKLGAEEGPADPATAISVAYCSAFMGIMWATAGGCSLDESNRFAARCAEPRHCDVRWLTDATWSAWLRISRAAISAAKRAASLGAPVSFAALMAFIENAEEGPPAIYGDMFVWQCVALSGELARLLEQGLVCSEIYHHALDCASALENAATRVRAVLSELLLSAEQVPSAMWLQWPHLHLGFAVAPAAVLSEIIVRERLAVAAPLSNSLLPPPFHVAEVGVRDANTSVALLRRFPSLQMLLVDPYDLNSDMTAHDRFSGHKARRAALARLTPYHERVGFLVEMSSTAASRVDDGSLDMVFIDGDHRYDYCREDIELWWPKLRPGGVLAGHDYHIMHDGVVRAVNEFSAKAQRVLKLSSGVWWFVRL